MQHLRLILRWFLYVVLVIVAAAIGALVVLTETERGRANLAGIVSSLASSDDRTVTVSGMNGIWSGELTADHVVIADKQGPWLVLRDVAVDWSPLKLLSKTFSADRVAAKRIELARLPEAGPQTDQTGGTTLPVDIDIRQIDLPEIALGQELAGAGVAQLAAKGSLKADAAPLAVQTDLQVARSDGRQGTVDAKIHYAPADDKLDLDVKASEPAGGIIANLLKLPGAPPVDITLSGKGPLADWSGSGTVAVDGKVVTKLTGRHQLTDKGNRIEAKGDGSFESFVPADFKQLLTGQTSFDIVGTRTNAGGIEIDHASFDSDTVHGTAAGIADPDGASDLSVELAAKEKPVVLFLGSNDQPVTLMMDKATVRLFGDGKTPMVDVGFSLASVVAGGTSVQKLQGLIHSDGFDILNRSGPVDIKLTAASLNTDVATLAPLVTGRLSADLAGSVDKDQVSLDKGTLLSDALNASVTAKLMLADLSLSLAMKADAASTALPPQIRMVLGPRVQFSATASRDPQGDFAANSLELTSGTLTASGTARTQGADLLADLKGSLGDVSVLSPLVGVPVGGGVSFALTAKGVRTAPDFTVSASSDRLSASGRTVGDVKLTASGKADIDSPTADVSLTGTVENKPLKLSAALNTVDGRRSVNNLVLALGDSRLSGDLGLTDEFLPTGTLALAIPDLAPLAALAGQQAQGDVNGTIGLAASGGVPSVSIKATSQSIARGDLSAKAITLDTVISDYLKTPGISGTIKADQIVSGSTVVGGIAIDLKQDGEWTGVSGAATIAGIPATIAGRAKLSGGTTTVELASGAATLKGVEAALAGPSTITYENGIARFDGLALAVGDGSVKVSGSAGAALNLTADITALPAAIANAFQPGLDAAGTLDGSAQITGASDNPQVYFDVKLNDAATSQTRQAGLGPVAAAATGTYSGEAGVSLDRLTVTGEGISASAAGTAKPVGDKDFQLSIAADLGALPAALANPFMDGLDAAGTLSGKFHIDGTASDPLVRFDARLAGAETSQTRQAGTGPLDVAAAGAYSKDGGVELGKATVAGQGIAASVAGTAKPAGGGVFALDLNADVGSLPAALANPYVAGLDAAGTLSGTFAVGGTSADPSVRFDARLAGAETSQTREARTGPLDLAAKGTYAKAAGAAIEQATVAGDGIAGSITGTVKPAENGAFALALDADIGSLPAMLANPYMADLDAAGTLSGKFSVGGTTIAPTVRFDASLADAEVRQTRDAKLGPLDLTAKGTYSREGGVALDSARVAGKAIAGTISGTASPAANGGFTLALDADIAKLPVALANAFRPDLDADGVLSGTFKIEGTTSDPAVRFDAKVAAAETSQTRKAKVGPLDLTAKGTYAKTAGVALEQATVTGAGISGSLAGTAKPVGDGDFALALDANVANLPLALANIARPDLDAAGALSGTFKVEGPSSNPSVRFDAKLAGAQTSQTRQAKVGPLDVTAKGAYANAAGITLDQATVTGEGISASAKGTAKRGPDGDFTLALDADIANLPLALANIARPDLGASGMLNGTLKVSGAATDPSVQFDVKLSDAETSQTRQAKVGPLDLTAKGTYAKQAGAAIEEATIAGAGIAGSVTGTLKPAGDVAFALDLNGKVDNLPVALANVFRPDLGAAGTLSGTFAVQGPATDPAVRFDARLTGAETSQTRQAGLGPFDLAAAGSYSQAAGVAINHATVQGEKIAGKASGTLNPSGASDFALDLATTGANLPISLGSAESPIDIAIQSVSLKAAGTGQAARLDLTATLPSVTSKFAKVEGLAVTLHSDAFDVGKREGPLTATVTADAVGVENANLAPLLAGKVVANVTGSMTNDAITITDGAIRSDKLAATLDGRVSLTDGAVDLNVKADADSAALPEAARGVLGARTKVSAAVRREANGDVAVRALDLASGPLTAKGDATLTGDQIAANVEGGLADISLLSSDAQGAIRFSLSAQGPSGAPELSLTTTSDKLTVASRDITGLKLVAKGKADLENPAADVSLTGTVAGQPLRGSAVLKSAGGMSEINGLDLSLGQNKISGNLTLDQAFVPEGVVTLNVPDLGPLAALALEKAEGDLSGTVRFSKTGKVPQIAVDLKSGSVTRGDLSARKINVQALIADYLKAPAISGTVRADSVVSGGTVINGIDIDLKRDGAWTGFSGGATIKDIPVKAAGRVNLAGGTTTIQLNSAQATMRGVKASIAKPTTVIVKDGTTTLDRLALNLGGGTATVSGTVGQSLNINGSLSGVPLSVANAFSPGLDAAGSISGTVKATGDLAHPTIAFDIKAAGVQTAQTRGAGLAALSVASTGSFSGGKLSFDATIGGGSGLGLKGGGTVTVAGTPQLSLDFSGSVPFAVLSQRLAAQGLSLDGAASVSVQVRGSASAPVISGNVTTSGARFVDSGSGIAVNDISADIGISNSVATINRMTGRLSTRGALSASGTVGIDPAQGFPANLAIKLTDGRYTDGRVVTANLGGNLTVTGPLASAPTIAGTIDLAKTVITVPQKLPTSITELNVKRKNAPAAVRAQDKALRPPSASGKGGVGLNLDVTINAPNQIFIQGRGVDAELGGSLRLTGPASSPQAVGSFDLIRGRLSIIGKRLTFTEGKLTFSGSLVPYINLTATSTATDATVTILVSGEATNPKFTFTSAPALPEDEVLARLVFGRSMANLSPLQIAQLAEAAAQFAGVGGSTSLLENLRSKLGVDDLDINTDENGNTAVSAGKYLNDRTYVTIQKGEKPGSGKATIDLNVGRGVKLRGEATDAGQAKGGIFYEKEY